MIILGIDPGYERIGIAIIEKKPGGKETWVYSECFKTLAKELHSQRLFLLGQRVEGIIKKYQPEVMSIETLFFESNVKTAMKVAEARGVLIYEGKKAGLRVREFTPLQIKTAVTGYGKSDKSQMMFMVEKLVKLGDKKAQDDEYDAIAAALTAFAVREESYPQVK